MSALSQSHDRRLLLHDKPHVELLIGWVVAHSVVWTAVELERLLPVVRTFETRWNCIRPESGTT